MEQDIELEMTEIAYSLGNTNNFDNIPGLNSITSGHLNMMFNQSVREIKDMEFYLNSLNNGYSYRIMDITLPIERVNNIMRYIVASAIMSELKKEKNVK